MTLVKTLTEVGRKRNPCQVTIYFKTFEEALLSHIVILWLSVAIQTLCLSQPHYSVNRYVWKTDLLLNQEEREWIDTS